MNFNKDRIAILGAGPVGFTLALLLAKTDKYIVDVFEKKPDPAIVFQHGEGRSVNYSIIDRGIRAWERAGVWEGKIKSLGMAVK